MIEARIGARWISALGYVEGRAPEQLFGRFSNLVSSGRTRDNERTSLEAVGTDQGILVFKVWRTPNSEPHLEESNATVPVCSGSSLA